MDLLPTIKEFLMYLKVERCASPFTATAYGHDLAAIAKYLQRQGINDLKEITTALLRQFFLEIQQTNNYKTNTLCRKINGTRSFFNYCQNQEYIIANPMNKRFPAPH